MPMTLAQAIEGTQDRLNELGSTGVAWQTSSLRRWINEGVQDVARRTETLLVHDDIPIAMGASGVALPANVLRVHQVAYTEATDRTSSLEYRAFNAIDATWYANTTTAIQARPREFTLRGAPPTLELLVNPRPSVAGTITVHYYKLPAKLATDGSQDASALEVVEAYTDLVLDYACFVALRRDRDPRWQEHRLAYEENLKAMLDQTRHWSDQAAHVNRQGHAVPDWIVYG